MDQVPGAKLLHLVSLSQTENGDVTMAKSEEEFQAELANNLRHFFFKPDGTPRTKAERRALVEQGEAVAAARKAGAQSN